MKKIIFSLLTVTALFSMTGCVKDKDYDNQNYGIQNTETKGIGFVQRSYVAPLNADATPQTIPGINAGLSTNDISTVDVKFTVASDFTVLPATVDGVTITPLPAGSFTFTAANTVPAGKTFGNFPIVVPNASLLDPNKTYGAAFRIVSADAGYAVAQNSRTFYVTINIKNKYDGRYTMNGVHNRVPYDFPYTNITMDMYTSGPSSVRFYIPISGFTSFGHPIGTAPGVIGWYGSTVSPNVTFDPVTNLVTNVNNADPGGAPPISIYTGAGSGVGRYDPVAKKMYVYWRYNANDQRGFMDTLTYTGPRP